MRIGQKRRDFIEQRVNREREAHTRQDVLSRSYEIKDRFSHIWHFPSRRRLNARIESYMQDVMGKMVLDLGCGRGQTSLKYLKRGAIVHGIDISPVYIAEANKAACSAGYPVDRFKFHVMDAHNLEFKDNNFDIVIGYGILHHLDADMAMNEIYRVLRPRGRVLLLEPLADNPLLKLFRLFTPEARTRDERPFSHIDIQRLSHCKPWKTEMGYCGFLEAPVAMVTSLVAPRHNENFFLNLTDRVERWAHEKGILLAWNQYVLINMVKQNGSVAFYESCN